MNGKGILSIFAVICLILFIVLLAPTVLKKKNLSVTPESESNTNTTNNNIKKDINLEKPQNGLKFSMTVNGVTVPFTESAPFGSQVNKNGGTLSIFTTRQEGGTFVLSDFDVRNLKVGTFPGSYFKLSLIGSTYNYAPCTNDSFRNNAVLSITEYSENSIKGYYAGKLSCGNSIIYFGIPFSNNSTQSGYRF